MIPFVVVVGFDKEEKVAFERIYWDQASVVAQLRLIDKTGLPIAGAEQAARLLDPTLPSNTFLKIEVSSLRLLSPRCAFALRLRLNLPWRLLLRHSSPPHQRLHVRQQDGHDSAPVGARRDGHPLASLRQRRNRKQRRDQLLHLIGDGHSGRPSCCCIDWAERSEDPTHRQGNVGSARGSRRG